jgi:ribosomal protein S18 acetylase RimI-like enzyme
MEITIVRGSLDYLNDCEDILVNSELGIRYFSKEGSARKTLEQGFDKEEIYIALDTNNNCKGFIWFILDGIFHSSPYLHIIAVNKESRKQGIGKRLLNFFEGICFKEHTKIFLVVADFNLDAKMLYERIGYVEVGNVPNLYREGINEHIMMKLRGAKDEQLA